jgi:Tfp pilus assembly protein PilF
MPRVARVTLERTLGRVEEDLRKGDTAMARTRLKSFVQAVPQSLAARERLADVYRLEGERVEAGRWSYLSEKADREEVEAFERACGRDPIRIMRGLCWSGR